MRVALLATATIALASPLAAQDAAGHPRNPVLFLEKSYFFPLAPYGRNLLFEGEAAGHYFMWNGVSWTLTREGGWAITVPATMIFSVRMLRTKSEPVRTPSYRIGLKPQLLYVWPEGDDPSWFRVAGFSGGFTHYSNGQAGCTYQGFTRPAPDADCVVSDLSLAADRQPNVIDGDFSTSYLSLAVHGMIGRHFGNTGPISYQHSGSLEFQLHPLGLRPGGMNREQALEYGQHTIVATYEGEKRLLPQNKFRGLARFAAKGGYRMPFEDGRSGNYLTLETSYVFDCLDKWGAVIRANVGSDYYNINFRDRRPLFAIGMMWDPGRVDAFNRAARDASPRPSPPIHNCGNRM